MSEFKARIGNGKPPAGYSTIVFSVKTSSGSRLELTGEFSEDVVQAACKLLSDDMATRDAAGDA